MKAASKVLVALIGLIVVGAPVMAAPSLEVSPRHLKFGNQPFGSFETETLTITNTSAETLFVTITDIDTPDDISPGQPGSTCFLSFQVNELSPGETCTFIVGFEPDPFFEQPESSRLLITASTEAGVQVATIRVRISGRGVERG
jgi:hypothetical protein